MNWIRKNTFLAVFFGVTAVCLIALAVFVYFQYDNYSAITEELNTQAAELSRLQTLAPFPAAENLAKVRELNEGLKQGVTKLEAQLVKMAPQVDPVAPEQFQDKLRASVLATNDLAQKNGVKLPEKFYLGFDSYETLPPKKEATLALGKQLAGVEELFKILLANGVNRVNSVKRTILPEEDQAPAAAPGAQPPQAQDGPVQKVGVEIAFKGDQSKVRKALDAIACSTSDFFIIRNVQVHNEKPKAPSKKDPEDKKLAQAVAEGGHPAAPALKFILGTEKLDVTAQIEIVSFKPTAAK